MIRSRNLKLVLLSLQVAPISQVNTPSAAVVLMLEDKSMLLIPDCVFRASSYAVVVVPRTPFSYRRKLARTVPGCTAY
jgi:hypothetical protein